jgi:hypothetical protein
LKSILVLFFSSPDTCLLTIRATQFSPPQGKTCRRLSFLLVNRWKRWRHDDSINNRYYIRDQRPIQSEWDRV